MAFLNFSFVFLVVCSIPTGSASFAALTANGYENIIVNFDQVFSSGADNCSTYITNVQDSLTALSDALCTATDSAAFLKTVYVVVPQTWTNQCLVEAEQPWLRPHHADIHIITNHPISGNDPITFQYGGCADPALPMLVPAYYLNPANTAPRKGHALLHEWAHYRYGVFDERGVKGDRVFPAVFRIEGKAYEPNSCTDEAMIGQWMGSANCASNPDSTCDWSAPAPDNQHIESSLMYRTDFPNMTRFCTNTTHSSMAPNKQNWFCQGKSAQEVIMSHKDFKTPANGTCFKPTFHVVTKPTPKLLFILDTSSAMDYEDRFADATEALAEFIWYLNDGQVVSLITFDDSAVVRANWTSINSTSKKSLLRQIDNLSPRGSAAGFQAALELALSPSYSGHEVILLTAITNSSQPANFSSLAASFRWQRTSVHVLSFGFDSFDSLSELAVFGSSVFIPDWSARDPSFLVRNAITVAVGQLQNIYSKIIKPRVKIFEARHNIAPGSTYSGSFTVDSGGSRLIFTVSSVGGISGNLQSGTGSVASLFPVTNSLLYEPGISLDNPLGGSTWTYSLSTSPNDRAFVSVDVWLEDPVSYNAVAARAWTSALENGPIDVDSKPVALYALLVHNLYPVIDANVVAYIYGESESGHVELIANLTLQDSGPADTTAGDGIYSAYVPSFSSNSTKHVVVVECSRKDTTRVYLSYPRNDHYVAGSSITGTTSSNLLPFQRYIYGVDFVLSDIVSSSDTLPPARVSDLLLFSEQENQQLLKISLFWTAPRDNLGSSQTIVNNFTVSMQSGSEPFVEIYKGTLTPDANNLVRFYYNITTNETRLVSFHVTSVDSSGNQSPPSNTARVYVYLSQDNFDYALFWGLLGPGIAIVVILLVVLLVWLCKTKKVKTPALRRQAARKETQPQSSSRAVTATTEVTITRTYGRDNLAARDLSDTDSETDNRPRRSHLNQSYESAVSERRTSRIDPQLAAIIRDNGSRIDLTNVDNQSQRSSHISETPPVYTVPVRGQPYANLQRQDLQNAPEPSRGSYGFQDPRFQASVPTVTTFTGSALPPLARVRAVPMTTRQAPPPPRPPRTDYDRGSLV